MTPDEFRAAFALSKGEVVFKKDGNIKKAKVSSVIRGENAMDEDKLIVLCIGDAGDKHLLYTSEIESVV